MPAPITLNDLPRDGRDYRGEVREDLFALTGEFDPVFVPPLVYDLFVKLDDGDICISGKISATFQVPCVRCGQPVPWRVEMPNYVSKEPRDGEATLDLTERIREDTLLALPGYPRCEESNVEPRPCAQAGGFPPESEFVPLSEEETSELPASDVWGALDSFPTDSPSQSDSKKPLP